MISIYKGALGAIAMSIACTAAGEYVADVVFPDGDSSVVISLELDPTGYAKRDYDAYLSYPSEYEKSDVLQPAKWEKRGLGYFVEIAATNMGSHINLAVALEDARLVGWNTVAAGDASFRGPIFRVLSISSTNLHTWLGHWLSFTGMRDDESLVDLKVRIREMSKEGDGSKDDGSSLEHLEAE